MTMDKVLEAILLAKPGVTESMLKNSKDLYGQGIIDSLAIFIIIDELNAMFNINIGMDEFTRDDFKTVDNIYALVKKYYNF
jgi:acyl carrier protein